MMEQCEDAASNHNLKPQQSDDEDADFPEFEFPVGDCVDVDGARLAVRVSEAENGAVGLRVQVDDSPKKMPPAMRDASEPVESVRLKVQEPEVSKHVVAEESKIPMPPQISLPSQRKVLQSNPSFKSLVTLLGEPLKFRGPVATDDGDAVAEKPPVTPTSKRLSGILQRVNAKVAAAAAAQTQSADGANAPTERGTAARPATSTLSVNALVEKFSTGVRTRTGEHSSRRDSLASPRNLSSPRRTVAPDRSRSPTLLREPHAPTTPSQRSRPQTDRSVSPLTRSSWKDCVYGDIPKDRRPNLSKPDATPPPRFLTPTRAAALKAVKPPTTPSSANSRSLQFTTAFGITTPVKPVEHTPRRPKETPTRIDHHAKFHTEPTGFNFRTDERAERRKDFYSKLEERLKAKEMERKRADEKAQQEKENQLRELRKSLTYKANPVPRFYQEPSPAAPEIRRIAPTRAKSPNFTVPRRRDSCPGGSTMSEGGHASRTSPLRSKALLRCASLESNGGHSSSGYKPSIPKPKQPFRPV